MAAAATLYQPQPQPLALVVAWKVALIAVAPLTLWVTGFFEPREKRAIRRLLRRPREGRMPV